MSCNVAFIGLGVMGYPMAGYISKAGHNVTVYNRTAAKATEGADYVFTCVGNDNDLREVTFGENGIFKTIKKVPFILITQLHPQRYLEKFMITQRKMNLVHWMLQYPVVKLVLKMVH